MAHTVRPRLDEIEKRAVALGLDTHSAQARRIGVHVAIHNRIMNGVTRELSGPYVVGILLAFGPDCVRDALHELLDIELDDREPVAS